jgi:hypothetical protein
LNRKPILVVCNDAWTANKLTARITEACGEIAYAANKLEALQQLNQFEFTAAVLTRQADTDGTAEALKTNHVPFCILETSAGAAVTVPTVAAVVVADIDLVVPALRALVALQGKDRSHSRPRQPTLPPPHAIITACSVVPSGRQGSRIWPG